MQKRKQERVKPNFFPVNPFQTPIQMEQIHDSKKKLDKETNTQKFQKNMEVLVPIPIRPPTRNATSNGVSYFELISPVYQYIKFEMQACQNNYHKGLVVSYPKDYHLKQGTTITLVAKMIKQLKNELNLFDNLEQLKRAIENNNTQSVTKLSKIIGDKLLSSPNWLDACRNAANIN